MNFKERTNGIFALGVYSISIAMLRTKSCTEKSKEREKKTENEQKNGELRTRMYMNLERIAWIFEF